MRLKVFIMIVVFAGCLALPVFAEGEKNIGGHVKLILFDYANGIHAAGDSQFYSTQSNGTGFMAFVLYFSQALNENISVDIQPVITAVTGATPVLGNDIGAQRASASGTTLKFSGVDWGRAALKMYFPKEDYYFAAGVLKPRFTLEYGAEMFWDDELSGGKFAINDFVGRMQSAGMEVVKTFSFGDLTMPAYLYALNGTTQFSDNNNQPMAMIHAEPEIGPVKFTASFAAGRYDDNEFFGVTRWSGGASVNFDPLIIRAEYAGGKWEKAISGVRDATPYGIYAKVFYKLSDWMRLMYHFDYVYHNFTGFTAMSQGPGEKYITNTPGVVLTVFDTQLQFRVDIADWSNTDGTEQLLFTRTVLGWRATF